MQDDIDPDGVDDELRRPEYREREYVESYGICVGCKGLIMIGCPENNPYGQGSKEEQKLHDEHKLVLDNRPC